MQFLLVFMKHATKCNPVNLLVWELAESAFTEVSSGPQGKFVNIGFVIGEDISSLVEPFQFIKSSK